jgi:hypothetical protein
MTTARVVKVRSLPPMRVVKSDSMGFKSFDFKAQDDSLLKRIMLRLANKTVNISFQKTYLNAGVVFFLHKALAST